MNFRQEQDAWLRILDLIQSENIMLKTRLTEIVKHDISTDVLEQVEYFQNQFLNKDTIITLLRYDIVEHRKACVGMSQSDFDNNGKLVRKQKKLREDMDKMEKEFNRLKFLFNSKMAELVR